MTLKLSLPFLFLASPLTAFVRSFRDGANSEHFKFPKRLDTRDFCFLQSLENSYFSFSSLLTPSHARSLTHSLSSYVLYRTLLFTLCPPTSRNPIGRNIRRSEQRLRVLERTRKKGGRERERKKRKHENKWADPSPLPSASGSKVFLFPLYISFRRRRRTCSGLNAVVVRDVVCFELLLRDRL